MPSVAHGSCTKRDLLAAGGAASRHPIRLGWRKGELGSERSAPGFLRAVAMSASRDELAEQFRRQVGAVSRLSRGTRGTSASCRRLRKMVLLASIVRLECTPGRRESGQITMRSISSRVTVSAVRSYSFVVFGDWSGARRAMSRNCRRLGESPADPAEQATQRSGRWKVRGRAEDLPVDAPGGAAVRKSGGQTSPGTGALAAWS